jgi:uncharacterized protein (DUF2384 family)
VTQDGANLHRVALSCRPYPTATRQEVDVPVLDSDERSALEDVDGQLERLQESLQTAAQAGAVDDELLQRLDVTARQVLHRLNHNLPPHLDADARDEIRRRSLDLLTQSTDGMEPLDIADRAMVEAEAVRHIVRDVLQEQPPARLLDAGEIVRLIESWVPTLTVKQVAELLGLSERALQRRRAQGGESTHRQQIVARLIAVLRHGWTDQGVYAWFQRPRPGLAGLAPIDVLDDPAMERELVLAARAGRVQGGS